MAALPDAIPINLQFSDESFSPDGFHTLPVLRRDSRIITGAPGRRMPVIRDMLDSLADVARARACRYFLFVNADIEVTPDALAWIADRGMDAYAFSRADLDPATRAFAGMMTLGLDGFAFDVAWWERAHRHFRPYVAGGVWDNVYAAVLCARGRGQIVSDQRLLFHERHPSTWSADDASAVYNGFLAALDAPYFSRWAEYSWRLDAAAAEGRAVDCDAIVRDVFSRPLLTPAGYARHAARMALARVRYAYQRRMSS